MKKSKLFASAAIVPVILSCAQARAMEARDMILRARALAVNPQEGVTGSSIDIDPWVFGIGVGYKF